MSQEPEVDHGRARGFAARAAIIAYSAAGYWILPYLDINRWWAPFVGLLALAAYSVVSYLTWRLSAAAGALYLRRIESEKLAAVGPELSPEALEKLQQEWTEAFSGPAPKPGATTTSAAGGDA